MRHLKHLKWLSLAVMVVLSSLGAVRLTGVSSTPSTQWEYNVVEIPVTATDATQARQAIAERLRNEAGDGWELVGIMPLEQA